MEASLSTASSPLSPPPEGEPPVERVSSWGRSRFTASPLNTPPVEAPPKEALPVKYVPSWLRQQN